MSRYVRIVLILALVLIALPVLPVSAANPINFGVCQTVSLDHGAIGYICMPTEKAWNKDLVIFAHGYVPALPVPPEYPPFPPIIPFDQLELDGVSVPEMVTRMGYAFAVTSYRVNGLAILNGVDDLVDLRQFFIDYIKSIKKYSKYQQPPHTYVVGVSEGGLIATQAIEQKPDIFSGGLACCGPVGDFSKQINYWGDFRVVYDYLFPGILTDYGGSAMNVPLTLMQAWATGAVPFAVGNALAAYPVATAQLLNVTKAAGNPLNPSEVWTTISGILWYSVFATNDGIEKLTGIPFDNNNTVYSGSLDDTALNAVGGVARFPADTDAINAIKASYQTTGKLTKPLVTMHTTLDPVVPYWHEVLYRLKNWKSGTGANHLNIPIIRYGHCKFTPAELVFGFSLLVFKATRAWPTGAEQALPNAALRDQFRSLQANSDNIVKPAVE